jgi:putative transposase
VLAGERQPLLRPTSANQVWSMDFVFDRTAESRVIKCLTIVDDATHEAVAIEMERAISGQGLTRVLDRLALSRGLPEVIRIDNGKEFCGKTMVTWAHERGVQLRLIEPGKPNQNSYIESFNGCLRDECLNEHWFTNLLHARTIIETWRREYNEERPKKALGGGGAGPLPPMPSTWRKLRYSNPGLQTVPLLKAGGGGRVYSTWTRFEKLAAP